MEIVKNITLQIASQSASGLDTVTMFKIRRECHENREIYKTNISLLKNVVKSLMSTDASRRHYSDNTASAGSDVEKKQLERKNVVTHSVGLVTRVVPFASERVPFKTVFVTKSVPPKHSLKQHVFIQVLSIQLQVS